MGRTPKMISCPVCGSYNSTITTVDKNTVYNSCRRTRHCNDCGEQFYSIEEEFTAREIQPQVLACKRALKKINGIVSDLTKELNQLNKIEKSFRR